jgi:hypothetical protein
MTTRRERRIERRRKANHGPAPAPTTDTIETVLAKFDLELGIEALARGLQDT